MQSTALPTMFTLGTSFQVFYNTWGEDPKDWYYSCSHLVYLAVFLPHPTRHQALLFYINSKYTVSDDFICSFPCLCQPTDACVNRNRTSEDKMKFQNYISLFSTNFSHWYIPNYLFHPHWQLGSWLKLFTEIFDHSFGFPASSKPFAKHVAATSNCPFFLLHRPHQYVEPENAKRHNTSIMLVTFAMDQFPIDQSPEFMVP